MGDLVVCAPDVYKDRKPVASTEIKHSNQHKVYDSCFYYLSTWGEIRDLDETNSL